MNKFAVAVLGAAMFLVPGAASAATLSLAGTYSNFQLNSTGTFDLDNNLSYNTQLTALAGGTIGDGANVGVLSSGVKNNTNGLFLNGPANVTYTYLGSEAGYNNSLKFTLGGSAVFDNSTGFGTQYTVSATTGLLEFLFTSVSNAAFAYNNDVATAGMNIAYYLFGNATSALVLLDDFGAGPDSDFDDIGILITIASVPVPAGLPLLGAGLGLLGFFGWRKKRATATTA